MGRTKQAPKQFISVNLNQHENHVNHISNEPTFLTHLLSRQSILARLIFSLFPPIGSAKSISTDYEGSALNIFFLVCVLYNRLGKQGFSSSGSVMAIFLPILYVVHFSSSVWAICVCIKTNMTLREIACMTCYGLFGHTISLLLSTLSSKLFIPSLIVFGGLSSLRICGILLLKTRLPPMRFVLCTPATVIHLLFLVYLHIIVTG